MLGARMHGPSPTSNFWVTVPQAPRSPPMCVLNVLFVFPYFSPRCIHICITQYTYWTPLSLSVIALYMTLILVYYSAGFRDSRSSDRVQCDQGRIQNIMLGIRISGEGSTGYFNAFWAFIIHSFIHSGHFYSAPSSLPLLRGSGVAIGDSAG